MRGLAIFGLPITGLGAGGGGGDAVLLEPGGFVLLETGGKILLEV